MYIAIRHTCSVIAFFSFTSHQNDYTHLNISLQAGKINGKTDRLLRFLSHLRGLWADLPGNRNVLFAHFNDPCAVSSDIAGSAIVAVGQNK